MTAPSQARPAAGCECSGGAEHPGYGPDSSNTA